ncbi:MAG: D-glycerate dehydrogenase [Betaproteobacteria bacterium]|nr:D-glycerate dehydrogenase [Betaproteobacteria bacterium]
MTPPSKPRLFITRRLPDAVQEHAAKTFEMTLWPEDRPIGDAFDQWSVGMDAILLMATDRMDAERLARLRTHVKALATYSVGNEHIDLQAATRLRLPVFFTPDVLSDAVADIAMMLIIAAARDTTRAEAILRNGEWGPWSPTAFLGRHPGGRRLGLYGMGRIGQAIAKRARGFDLAIHYHNRTRLSSAHEQGAQYHATLDDLMRVSDVFCVAAPATPTTRKSVNAARIALLPRGAIFTNIARGDLVDEDALIDAITSGHIGAAGLDVYAREPNLDPRFKSLPNTTLLPHIGSAAIETRVAMGLLAVDALANFILRGEKPRNCLNPEVLH